MRNAPSVLYPVGRCALYARWLLGLGALGLLALVGGWWLSDRTPGVVGVPLVGVVLWLLWMGFAAWSWQRTPEGLLQWDALADSATDQSLAGAWVWYSEAYRDGVTLLRVDAVLDLQGHVLLRLHNPDAVSSWAWVERTRDPLRWNEFRRALMAHKQQSQAIH